MRIFNNRMPDLAGSATKLSLDKPAASHAAGSPGGLPPGLDSAGLAERASYMRSRGQGLAHKLHNMFKSSGPAQNQGIGSPHAAKLAFQSHTDSYRKFLRHEAGVNQALAKWSRDEESLEFLLKPYNLPANQRKGSPSMDGLRSGVTALLTGIQLEGSNASPELRAAAKQLSETVIFKAPRQDGTLESFTLTNFASVGVKGTGAIDDLNISPEQRQQIAERLSLALAELRDIGAAYTSQAVSAPSRRMHDEDHVLVSSPGADLARRNALRRRSASIPAAVQRDSHPQAVTNQPRPADPRPVNQGTTPPAPGNEQRLRRPPSIYGPGSSSAVLPAQGTQENQDNQASQASQASQKIRRPPLKPKSRRGA